MNGQHLQRLKAHRRLWLQVHLYLGLLAGFIIAIVGLTGAILVFYEELQELLNAEQIRIVAPPLAERRLRPLDEIIAAADTIKPANSRFDKLYYPRHEDAAYKLLYYQPPPAKAEPDESGDGYYVFVNPYTAQATGKQLWHPYRRYWGRPLVSFVMQLHYCLLLDTPGMIFVGIMSTLALLSVLSGLIVWWPLTGKWHLALTIKRGTGSIRYNYDLHKVSGFYSALVLLAVLFSGVYFNLPDNVNALVRQFSPLQRPNAWEGMTSSQLHSDVKEDQKPISPGQAEEIVSLRHPGGQMWMLSSPADAHGTYYIWKREVAELSRFIGYREIAIDQYSGKILKVYDAGGGSDNDRILPGIVLMLAFCVLAPLLDTASKLATAEIPVGQITTARFLVQGGLMLPIAVLMRLPLRLSGRQAGLITARAAFLIASTYGFVAGVQVMPIADALAIVFVEPFILLVLGYFLFGNPIGPRRIAASVIGFAGALLVIQPSLMNYGTAALYPLISAFCFAFYMLITQAIAAGMHPVVQQAQTSVMGSLLCLPVMLWANGTGIAELDPVMPQGLNWLWLFGVGFWAAASHLCMTIALKFAPASTLAPLHYLEIVTAVAIGYLVFGDFPNALTWAGIGIIVSSGLYIIHRERITLRQARSVLPEAI